jgi:hypothetical protein
MWYTLDQLNTWKCKLLHTLGILIIKIKSQSETWNSFSVSYGKNNRNVIPFWGDLTLNLYNDHVVVTFNSCGISLLIYFSIGGKEIQVGWPKGKEPDQN